MTRTRPGFEASTRLMPAIDCVPCPAASVGLKPGGTWAGRSRRASFVQASSKVNPYTEAAYEAVADVRAVDAPAGVSFLVGGLSAGQSDFISTLYGKAPLAVGFVVAVTYLVRLIEPRARDTLANRCDQTALFLCDLRLPVFDLSV